VIARNTIGTTPMDESEILKYQPLVHHMARWFIGRYRRKTTYEDLCQAGWLGLLKGLKNYDPTRGITLGAYSRTWIWGSMYREAVGRKKAVIETKVGLPAGLEAINDCSVDLRDAVASLPPAAAAFVQMLWHEGETPETACARLGMIFVEPRAVLAEIQDLIKEAVIYGSDEPDCFHP